MDLRETAPERQRQAEERGKGRGTKATPPGRCYCDEVLNNLIAKRRTFRNSVSTRCGQSPFCLPRNTRTKCNSQATLNRGVRVRTLTTMTIYGAVHWSGKLRYRHRMGGHGLAVSYSPKSVIWMHTLLLFLRPPHPILTLPPSEAPRSKTGYEMSLNAISHGLREEQQIQRSTSREWQTLTLQKNSEERASAYRAEAELREQVPADKRAHHARLSEGYNLRYPLLASPRTMVDLGRSSVTWQATPHSSPKSSPAPSRGPSPQVSVLSASLTEQHV